AAPSAVTGSRYVFHIVHSAEERARALARFAVAAGKHDFAILGPREGYGRAVGDAFAQEVARLGGKVVVSAWYDPKTTSFGDTIKRLRKPWQAVFVPDIASRLELVAPALAAGNFISRPLGGDEPDHGRKVLLLSTAEFLDSSFLRSAGRYAEGAVLAPGFYPDRSDPRMSDVIASYEAAYGRLPTALEAYAVDAAAVVQAAVAAGARTRAEVAAFATRSQISGLTGEVSFGADLRRRDSGVLYQVQVSERGDYAIRALRK
ncbi:MAG TPA: ABC transporter substrate-binding protein, partial [Kofleriaceae bacterium]|nr:ABC transporter substrate-binding protein [Kofleriaceae bacterium]